MYLPHTALYTLSLHDALPILLTIPRRLTSLLGRVSTLMRELTGIADLWYGPCVLEPGVLTTVHGLEPTPRSEEHTSELQSRFDLVCRLLLEKKKQYYT